MNEVLVLERKGDPDDGMFSCFTGTIECAKYTKNIATFWEGRRAYKLIKGFLRKKGKSVREYLSTEEVLNDFLEYCYEAKL